MVDYKKKNIKGGSSLLYYATFFVLAAQNQSKSQIMFDKNGSPRDLYLLTLNVAALSVDCITFSGAHVHEKEFINRNKLIIKAFQIGDRSGKTNFVIYKGFIKVPLFSNSFKYIHNLKHSKINRA